LSESLFYNKHTLNFNYEFMRKSLTWAIISISLLILSAFLVYRLGKVVRRYEAEKKEKETNVEQVNDQEKESEIKITTDTK